MAGKDRRLRRIDEQLPFTGGADILSAAADAPLAPALPTIRPPRNLRVISGSAIVIYSAVTPQAGVTLDWTQPEGASPDSYNVQWSTSSSFTNPTTRSAGRATSAGVDGLPTGTLIYFRVQGVVRGVTGQWSSTVSTTTPTDTTPPAAPTSLVTSWSGLTGDLNIIWTNPTSANFRDVRVRVYASNGGALLREVYSATGRFVYTRAMNYADTSGSPDASVYLVLTARSWSNVLSATDLTGSATLSAPAAPSGLSVSFAGPDLVVTWTAGAVAGYRLTFDGVARELGYASRYTYTYATNAAEHSGTADPSVSVSLVAVDGLGQASSASSTTATNAAPAAPASVAAQAFVATLSIGVTATKPADFATFRYRLIQTSPSASDVTWDSAADLQTRALGTDATYQVGVRVVDVFGQTSGETLSSTVTADVLTTEELRAEAIYSDSSGANTPAALKAALADGTTGSGGIGFGALAAWRYIQVERPTLDRYKQATWTYSAANPLWYLALSADGVTWRWFAGPLVDGRVLTEVADEAAAQIARVNPAVTPLSGTRADLPAMVEARFTRFYHRLDSGGYTIHEAYPRRLVQGDDIEAESIQTINLAAGAVTAAKLTVNQLSAISSDMGSITAGTMTGATIRTAASGQRVELTSANGLRGIDSGGVTQVQISPSTGAFTAGAVTLDANGLQIAAGTGGTSAVQFVSGGITRSRVRGYLDGATSTAALEARDGTGSTTAALNVSSDGTASITLGSLLDTVFSLSESLAAFTVPVEATRFRGLGGGTAQTVDLAASLTDAVTTSASTVLTLAHNSSGTPAAGFGGTVNMALESSTTADRTAAAINWRWTVATDASRQGRGELLAFDAGGGREALRWQASGSAPQLGFFGAAAAGKPTVTGSRGGNAALASLLTELATLGLITNSTTA